MMKNRLPYLGEWWPRLIATFGAKFSLLMRLLFVGGQLKNHGQLIKTLHAKHTGLNYSTLTTSRLLLIALNAILCFNSCFL